MNPRRRGDTQDPVPDYLDTGRPSTNDEENTHERIH